MNDKQNIYKKLAKARVELQKRNLNKSGHNKSANFKYFELKDFLPSINEIFENLGLLSVFNLVNDLAELRIVDVDDKENSIVFTTPAKEAGMKGMTDIQALGSQHTYLKRYLYLNALEIVDNDVVDAITGDDEGKTDREKEEIDYIKLRSKLSSLGVDFRDNQQTIDYICKTAKVKHQDNSKLNDSEIVRLNNLYKSMIIAKEKQRDEQVIQQEKGVSLDEL